jgi:tripartite-type tricarboxylate transporter receptor subunit TctC
LPDVASFAESVPEMKDYELLNWFALFATAGTPAPVIARLNAEAVKALQSDEMKEKLALDGAQPVGSTPAEFAALIRSELDKWTRVARAAEIPPQ